MTTVSAPAATPAVKPSPLLAGAPLESRAAPGTPWAVREIVRRLGFGESESIEGLNGKYHNGEISRDCRFSHGHGPHWAHYRITLKQPVTNEQAALLRRTLQAFAPARCVLDALDYTRMALRHNGRALRDGTFNRGTA